MEPSAELDAARPEAVAGGPPVTAPPGAQPYNEELGRRLAEALAARGPG